MIQDYLKYISLTGDQDKAISRIENFINSNENIFILNGYAGSGKTTLIKGIAKYLKKNNKKISLMAPTGRAAKVLSEKTGEEAYTIHKTIYNFDNLIELEAKNSKTNERFCFVFRLRNNLDQHNTVFIIDESSMISNAFNEGEFSRFGSGKLLDDLITYTRVQDKNIISKIVFVGDPAQLPPIGMPSSPALDPAYLEDHYNIKANTATIKEVVRQKKDSSILDAAFRIRTSITSGFFNDFNLLPDNKDLFKLNYENVLQQYLSMKGSKIIISYKNKTANDFNKLIRDNDHGKDAPIQVGDRILIGMNNYSYGILNGDFGWIIECADNTVNRTIALRGKEPVQLSWRHIVLKMEDEQIVAGFMLENYLNGDSQLRPEEFQALYVDFIQRKKDLKIGTREFGLALKEDKFFNAIMLKYGYAVTCHKAQGGEWDNVITIWDKGVNETTVAKKDFVGKSHQDFYRWAYTAITRASDKLYCVDPPYFNSFSVLKIVGFKDKIADALKFGEQKVQFNKDLESVLTKLKWDRQSIALQDHLLKIYLNLNEYGIEITQAQKKGYEIWYTITKTKKKATYKYWVNKNDQFKTTYMLVPSCTDSDELASEVKGYLEDLKEFSISRDIRYESFNYDQEIAEKNPFLLVFFEELKEKLSHRNIHISNIENKEFHEVYHLKRGFEKIAVKINYNKKGFFTFTEPILKQCNSQKLLNDISDILEELKNKSHVVQGG